AGAHGGEVLPGRARGEIQERCEQALRDRDPPPRCPRLRREPVEALHQLFTELVAELARQEDQGAAVEGAGDSHGGHDGASPDARWARASRASDSSRWASAASTCRPSVVIA